MRPSRSSFVSLRGVRHHLRHWGEAGNTLLVLLHGWMDVSASFQFLADALPPRYHAVALDWRGFGLSDWNHAPYWFPDYLADLDALLDLLSPSEPVHLVAHSMGGNVAGLYAGIRPHRLRSLVNLEGFGMSATDPSAAPERYIRWLNELREPPRFRTYGTLGEVAARLQQTNPRLSAERAAYLAPFWSVARGAERFELRGDPWHKLVNAVLYRVEEAEACWRRATAPVLWVSGAESDIMKRYPRAELLRRMACFRDSREVLLAGAGHMVHHDQPEQLARHIDAFVPSVEA
jgi:pimeloyl-ACP methyl ester carboxylesterase